MYRGSKHALLMAEIDAMEQAEDIMRSANHAHDTVLSDMETVLDEVLLQVSKMELLPEQLLVQDLLENKAKDMRFKKVDMIEHGDRLQKQSHDYTRTSKVYSEVARKQTNPNIPLWIMLGMALVGFLMFCSVATGDSTFVVALVYMGILFVPLAPIALIISACMAQHNKKTRHRYGIVDRNMDMQDNITTAACIGGAASTGIKIAKLPGKVMRNANRKRNF